MVKVDAIKWLSKEAKEAEVFLSDGYFHLICFSHPFKEDIDNIITQPLYTLNAREIFSLQGAEQYSVEKEEETFQYKLIGKVVGGEENQIIIGKFILELDNPLPKDIQDGDFVSLICDRIDIY